MLTKIKQLFSKREAWFVLWQLEPGGGSMNGVLYFENGLTDTDIIPLRQRAAQLTNERRGTKYTGKDITIISLVKLKVNPNPQ